MRCDRLSDACRSPARVMPANCAAPRSAMRISKSSRSNGLAEWAVIDPGSAVFTRFDEIARGEAGYTYYNPDDHFYEGMRIGAQYGVRPSYAIYEAGCTRLGAAKAKQSPARAGAGLSLHVRRRILLRLSAEAVLSRCASAIACRLRCRRALDGGGPRRRYPSADRPAVERGGHVRVGLEDRPWGVAETNAAIGGGGGAARACGGRRAGDAGGGARGLRGRRHRRSSAGKAHAS